MDDMWWHVWQERQFAPCLFQDTQFICFAICVMREGGQRCDHVADFVLREHYHVWPARSVPSGQHGLLHCDFAYLCTWKDVSKFLKLDLSLAWLHSIVSLISIQEPNSYTCKIWLLPKVKYAEAFVICRVLQWDHEFDRLKTIFQASWLIEWCWMMLNVVECCWMCRV